MGVCGTQPGFVPSVTPPFSKETLIRTRSIPILSTMSWDLGLSNIEVLIVPQTGLSLIKCWLLSAVRGSPCHWCLFNMCTAEQSQSILVLNLAVQWAEVYRTLPQCYSYLFTSKAQGLLKAELYGSLNWCNIYGGLIGNRLWLPSAAICPGFHVGHFLCQPQKLLFLPYCMCQKPRWSIFREQ